MEKDFEKEVKRGNERLALVNCIWSLITAPLILLVPDEKNYVFFAVLAWLTWCILGIVLSPKIINKIWK